jgi:copper homeostasis protein
MAGFILEICANSVASAIVAQEGGADRVELCDNLPEGGTTPSFGVIESARNNLHIKLNVIIRPRGGDFLYDNIEFDIIKRDIEICKKLHVEGVVIGMLLKEGNIDKIRTKQLVELARPMSVTFHRAFDMTASPFTALEDIIETGCDRILTSGQAKTALEGASLISKLIEKAEGRIIIMPGAGIKEDNISEIIRLTGANEFHLSLRTPAESAMQYRNPAIKMGSITDYSEYLTSNTDKNRVLRIKEILSNLV